MDALAGQETGPERAFGRHGFLVQIEDAAFEEGAVVIGHQPVGC
jgi:hypothetical protein